MSKTFPIFATKQRKRLLKPKKHTIMSKEALEKLAGVFQEDFKKETGNPINEHKLGGEVWYE